MRGYRNQSAAMAATIDTDGWLHTADLASVRTDGWCGSPIASKS